MVQMDELFFIASRFGGRMITGWLPGERLRVDVELDGVGRASASGE